jgi:endothelin-converting enzyme
VFQITIPFEERRDEEKMYHKMNLKEIQALASFINWTEYFDYAFRQINVTIEDDEAIVIYTPDYLSNLSSLIQEYKSTKEGRM